MKNKDLIISLLEQDLIHHQLTENLKAMGLDPVDYHLDLCSVVAQLLGFAKYELPNQWLELYCMLMREATALPVGGPPGMLLPYAQKCYGKLSACALVHLTLAGSD